MEPGVELRCIKSEPREGSLFKSLRRLVVVALLATAYAADAVATGQPLPSQTTLAKAMATEAIGSGDVCPLTIPPQPGFVPPEPYPPEPPALYQAVWYGTPELWTMLRPDGEVWSELPLHNGIFGQKTFWWSDGYSPIADPTPSITVTGRHSTGQRRSRLEGLEPTGSERTSDRSCWSGSKFRRPGVGR